MSRPQTGSQTVYCAWCGVEKDWQETKVYRPKGRPLTLCPACYPTDPGRRED